MWSSVVLSPEFEPLMEGRRKDMMVPAVNFDTLVYEFPREGREKSHQLKI